MNNYEKIKKMTIDEMADVFRKKYCEECYMQDGLSMWDTCQRIDCWVKGDAYIKWLESEEV
jgi:hypothetical protein